MVLKRATQDWAETQAGKDSDVPIPGPTGGTVMTGTWTLSNSSSVFGIVSLLAVFPCSLCSLAFASVLKQTDPAVPQTGMGLHSCPVTHRADVAAVLQVDTTLFPSYITALGLCLAFSHGERHQTDRHPFRPSGFLRVWKTLPHTLHLPGTSLQKVSGSSDPMWETQMYSPVASGGIASCSPGNCL